MTTIVRASKFRHVFGTPYRREDSYENVQAQIAASEVNHIDVNSKYIAVAWKTGGGAIACLPWSQTGKLPPSSDIPLFAGHTAEIIDFKFAPFDDSLIATSSADCTVKLWQIPEGGLKENTSTPLLDLNGHMKKVTNIEFNPTADNVMLSVGYDNLVKIWDLSQGVEKSSYEGHPDQIQCASWNYDGSLIATTCKDKMLRIVDPRGNSASPSYPSHQGTKGSRCLFLGKSGKLLTTGFSKKSDRQFGIWDPRRMEEALSMVDIDQSSGSFMPFYDEDTQVLYLAGKGDTNIRYFEIQDDAPYQFFLSQYSGKEPQKGVGMIPKRSCDVSKCEISRFVVLSAAGITPVSFTVPRKGDQFQEDIYPDSNTGEAQVTSAQWFAGESKPPAYGTMRPGAAVVKKETAKRLSPAEVQAARIAELEKQVADLQAKLQAAGIAY